MTSPQPLRIIFAKGTAPGKWFARFNERTEWPNLLTTEADNALGMLFDEPGTAALVRLPDSRLEDPAVADEFHKVTLYDETPGIAIPKDSELTLLDTISPSDIEGEVVNYQPEANGSVDVEQVRGAVDVVAANVGVAIAPRPLLRSLSSKLTENRDFTGGQPTTIALVWRKGDDSDQIQDFVGICKGRTANTSRQPVAASAKKKAVKQTAKKTAKKPSASASKRKPGVRKKGRR